MRIQNIYIYIYIYIYAYYTHSDVQKILLSSQSHATSKKKAALCMLRLLRKYPEGFGEDGISGIPDQRDKLLDLLVCVCVCVALYLCVFLGRLSERQAA